MRTWLGTLVFVVFGTIALASGCGSPSVINTPPDPNANGGDGVGGGNGTAASAGFVIGVGDGGDSNTQCSTCEELNANCGAVTDPKCDTIIECGKCTKKGEFCGGDGPSRCGTGTNGDAGACSGNCMSCTPKTCKDIGFTCGLAGDDCGGTLDCGPTTCPILGYTCGGGAKEGQCGCTGACEDIPDCSKEAKKTTTLTGKVYDPAGNNPLYHVFVYVANNPKDPNLKSFPAGITCDVCGATAAGDPLLSEGDQAGTYTGVDGSFTLKNVPVAKGVTVVIQLGRWRRVFTIDIDTPCDENKVPDKTFLMPSKQSQGNIPLMAMVTGKVDSLECVLRKMGIDDSEFTTPSGGGRVQFYRGNVDWGQVIDSTMNTPSQDALFVKKANNQPVIDDYDMTILACQGDAFAQDPANRTALRNYAAAGGRVFATHYTYSWLTTNDENTAQKGKADNWSEVATWHRDEGDRADQSDGHIDLVSNPKGAAFQGWLEAVNASVPGSGIARVDTVRHDADTISSVDGQTQQWLYRDGENKHTTCNRTGNACTSDAGCTAKVCSAKTSQACTADADCNTGGKVCKNGPNQACTNNNQCNGNGNSCVTQTCVANTCQGFDYTGKQVPLHFTFNTPVNTVQDLTTNPPTLQCGRVLFSDFHVANTDEKDLVFPSACNNKAMTPQEKLLEFMIFDLGSCVPPPKACVPSGKCPANADCGYAPDGCGGLISCGKCPTGEACGVGNPPVPNKCGKGTQECVPETCATLKKECGPAADGCGDKIDSCGNCDAGELCVQGKCIPVN
ncbi:MAG: hypothetical protein ABUL62_19295 [Myxococcales bacterium]